MLTSFFDKLIYFKSKQSQVTQYHSVQVIACHYHCNTGEDESRTDLTKSDVSRTETLTDRAAFLLRCFSPPTPYHVPVVVNNCQRPPRTKLYLLRLTIKYFSLLSTRPSLYKSRTHQKTVIAPAIDSH